MASHPWILMSFFFFFGLMPSWDSCSWWFISYTAFRLLSIHPKIPGWVPLLNPLWEAPLPPCFSFSGSLLLSCDWLSAYLFPHLHWLWRPETKSWSLLNFSCWVLCLKQSGYAICFFIQQMKYWMLILPDCINIVCIFKKYQLYWDNSNTIKFVLFKVHHSVVFSIVRESCYPVPLILDHFHHLPRNPLYSILSLTPGSHQSTGCPCLCLFWTVHIN